mgnify:CR=1 FL=1
MAVFVTAFVPNHYLVNIRMAFKQRFASLFQQKVYLHRRGMPGKTFYQGCGKYYITDGSCLYNQYSFQSRRFKNAKLINLFENLVNNRLKQSCHK